MGARMKRQIGYALLGGLMLVIGLGLNDGDRDGADIGVVGVIGGCIALAGGVVLLTGLGGLIADLIRSED